MKDFLAGRLSIRQKEIHSFTPDDTATSDCRQSLRYTEAPHQSTICDEIHP